MPGRNYTDGTGYRYGYQSSEKDDEIKGISGSNFTTFFREYDARLGKTWSVDPKASAMPWQSPYTSMDNNPILFNDPMGDKVKFSRDKDVSRKEFRQMKKNIRELRKNSKTFATMYNDLDSRDEAYYYNATSATGGKTPVGENKINIGVNYTFNTETNGSESKNFGQLGMIAHETGHKFRELYNLDPPYPKVGEDMGGLIDKDNSKWNYWNERYQTAHESSETGALHIENIVRSELKSNKKYSSIQVHQYYSPAFRIQTDYNNKGVKKTAIMQGEYNLFMNGKYSQDYYNKNFNIYEELGIKK